MVRGYTHKFIHRLRSIHWMDTVAIGIFFAILAVALFFFLRRTEYITVRLRVSQSDELRNNITSFMTPLWYANVLKPGMEYKDFLGRSVIKIERVIPGFPEDNEQKTYIDLRIQALYGKQSKQYSYNGIPLLIGSYQRFRVNDIQIPGVIHAIGKEGIIEYPKKTYRLRGFLDQRRNDWIPGISNQPTSLVEYTGVYTYLAEKMHSGMEVKLGDTPIAKIVSVTKSPATKKVIQLGQVYTISDPERQRVELTVDVAATMINGRPYFKDDQQRLLINGTIELDVVYLKPAMTITDMQEMPDGSNFKKEE